MNTDEVMEHAKALKNRIQSYQQKERFGAPLSGGAKAQVCEFLRTYAGPKSSFLEQADRPAAVIAT